MILEIVWLLIDERIEKIKQNRDETLKFRIIY